jgi:glyoxylase-like metal-dependent hydrolase (beta-lactamase superfamily II)
MLEPAPRSQISIGKTTITYVPDGEVHLHPNVLFPASAPNGWAAYAPYLSSDGRLPVSVGSFLIRTPGNTILVDLGLGKVDFTVPDLASFKGGNLLQNLAAEGVAPSHVDLVLFTHLHHDHVGWTTNVAPAPNADPNRTVDGLTFAKARHLADRADWDHWSGTAEITGPDPEAVQKPLADVIQFLAAGQAVVPGILPVPTAGHTPGHTSLLVTDPTTDERVLILGDVMHTQAQVSETHWNFLFDVDAVKGTQTRIDLLNAYQDERTIIAGGHFAGSVFGRFLPAALRHGWSSIDPNVTA